MSINESKKYPSYNNFPFKEIPDYQTNYADLQEWHKDIGETLKKETLNSIIEDYGKGKNSTRKKAEATYELRSYTDFFDYVICPRFALNLCAKFKKKCNQLDDDLNCTPFVRQVWYNILVLRNGVFFYAKKKTE